MNSDEVVEALLPYGDVRVSYIRDGWYAVIELHVSGMSAKVDTGFEHPTMLSALQELKERVFSVVAKPAIPSTKDEGAAPQDVVKTLPVAPATN